ncbi:MAG: universal stress protein [Pseudomonadota bacterium]
MSATNRKKMVVAVDGSDPSHNAINYACEFGKMLGVELVMIHVIQTSQKVGYWAFIDKHFEKELQKYADDLRKESKEIAGKLGCDAKVEILEGVPYEEIVKFVEKEPGVVMLVMGTHGHSLAEKRLVGSTTDRVVREITKKGLAIPVTLVPYGVVLP